MTTAQPARTARKPTFFDLAAETRRQIVDNMIKDLVEKGNRAKVKHFIDGLANINMPLNEHLLRTLSDCKSTTKQKYTTASGLRQELEIESMSRAPDRLMIYGDVMSNRDAWKEYFKLGHSLWARRYGIDWYEEYSARAEERVETKVPRHAVTWRGERFKNLRMIDGIVDDAWSVMGRLENDSRAWIGTFESCVKKIGHEP